MTGVADLLRQLLGGMQADARSYGQLHDLLDAQLAAIAQQRAEELQRLAERITALCEELEERRRLRRALVAQLLGRNHEISMHQALERLPARAAAVLRESWQGLERAVVRAKQQNARNCELIVEQHALMQRLMGAEQDIYAEL